MLRLQGEQVESLWDEVLPVEVRQLPEDLAKIDEALGDLHLLEPIVRLWRETTPVGLVHGRPTIPMGMYVRLMVIKHRHGWGYETLMREVSDSLHLRRFCGIAIDQKVPDESTPRKMTRRLGAETVAAISLRLIAKAERETRFRARAVRIDSTVVEADVRYPNDAQLAADAARILAREGRKLSKIAPTATGRVRDRSQSVRKQLLQINRSLTRRVSGAKEQVLELTGNAGKLLEMSLREARRLVERARRSARGRGAGAKLRAAHGFEQILERAEKVARQITQRLAGERITDRLVSMSDPDARPIRKGKLKTPTQFGYVKQIAEITPHTRRGARGFVLPPASLPGNAGENELLPQTVEQIQSLGLNIREVAVDGGFGHHKTVEQLTPLKPDRIHITGRATDWSKRTSRRLYRYRTGAEGRISHIKRSYGLDRTRLKGQAGSDISAGWGTLAYNLDTYHRYT
ncbi:MAG TPA: transposase [Bradyrhizobium sp.]|nr:transposase [Bradyrhizobium sp.]